MTFKTFVINLDSSPDRLESIKTQCDALNIEFERVPAVYGAHLSDDEKNAVFNLEANIQKYHKPLNNGEIGCYLSHIRCFQKILDDGLDYALILEDDSELDASLADYIKAVSELTMPWDYIKLSRGSKEKKHLTSQSIGKGINLRTAAKLPSTTTGQFVSRSGAEKLIAHAYPIARPIDVDIQYWFEKSLTCFVAEPLPVKAAGFDSKINEIRDRSTEENHRLRRIYQKAKFEIMLHLNKHDLPRLY